MGWSSSRVRRRTFVTVVAAALFVHASSIHLAARAEVRVATEAQLQTAISRLTSGTTIVLAPGIYRLTKTLWIHGPLSNVTLKGRSGNRDDIVLQGSGMTTATASVPFGIWSGGNVESLTIANLTIRHVYTHGIVFNAGTQRPVVSNVRLLDIGEQLLKSNPSSDGSGVNGGVVENSAFEYTSRARSSYTNAIDVHAGRDWVIRGNVFENIQAPAGRAAGPAILMWNGAGNTLTDGNRFLNCHRAIAYGLVDKPSGTDHAGGVIRNNIISRTSSQPGDVGIMVADSPGTQVLNNTVILSGTYPSAIEYRFAGSTGVLAANNLVDGVITRRDGATGSERNNVTGASSSLFVNAAAGDFHLAAGAAAAIDRGAALANVTNDYDGDSRPQGAAFDVGADEYGARPTRFPRR